MRRRAALVFGALSLAAAAAWAAELPAHVRAELLRESAAAEEPGAPFIVGVRLTMEKDWHTYWQNPGDGGLPTEIQWNLPEGFKAGPVQWPAPRRFGDSEVMNYGYEGEAVLLTQITPPASAAADAPITAKVSWLSCNKFCVPGSADVRIVPADPKIFDAARAALPREAKGWSFAAARQGGAVRFSMKPPEGEEAPAEAYLFPEEPNTLDYEAPQKLETSGGGSALTLKVSEAAGKPPERLKGVLMVRQKMTERAFSVDVPVFIGSEIGKPAPDFSLNDPSGAAHSLADAKGKLVVLEWTNPDCPFVKKHYGSGNMQKLQADYTAKGVVWYTIASSAPGKQGHYGPEDWKGILQKRGDKQTALLLDPDGAVGRLYGAKTTPHVFVVGKDGVLLYKGAIDDKPSTDPADVAGARNLVAAALDEALDGKPVSRPVTESYGCSVKY